MTERIDPALTSPLDSSVITLYPTTQLGFFVDTQGREWYQIREGRHGAGQMLFARLMKGVVPACSIIRKTHKSGEKLKVEYFSLFGRPEDLKENIGHGQLFAIHVFLEKVFKDADRAGNAVSRGGKSMYFDFEALPIFFMHPSVYGRNDPFYGARLAGVIHGDQFKRIIEQRLQDLSMEDLDSHVHELPDSEFTKFVSGLKRLLTVFRETISDRAYVESIVRSINEPLSSIIYFPPEIACANEDCYFEHFYDALVHRTSEALDVVRQYEESKMPK